MNISVKTGSMIRVGILVLVMMVTASCAYRFAGKDAPPFGMEKICVEMFENRTSEIGVESIFTNDMIDEMTRDGRVKVVTLDRADGVVKGIIREMNIDTLSRRDNHIPTERRVFIYVDVFLEDNSGNTLKSMKNMVIDETYDVAADKRETEMNRRAAVSEISVKLARDIYQRLTWEGRNIR